MDAVGYNLTKNLEIASSEWKSLNDFPIAFHCGASFSINGKGYISSGFSSNTPIKTTYEFNPLTQTWSQVASADYAKGNVEYFTLNNEGYIIGGEDATGVLTTAQKYNPASNSWTTITSLLIPKTDGVGFAINGKGYIVGGGEMLSNADIVGTTYEYDPVTNSWTPKANMITRRRHPACFVINDKAYIATGLIDIGQANNVLEEYDPANDTWTPKTDCPWSLFESTGFTINNKGYIVGGGIIDANTGDEVNYNTNFCYDPIADSWVQETNALSARGEAINFVLGGIAYVIGGRTADTTTLATVEAFVPEHLKNYNNLLSWLSKESDFIGYSIAKQIDYQEEGFLVETESIPFTREGSVGFTLFDNNDNREKGFIVIGYLTYCYDPLTKTWSNRAEKTYYTIYDGVFVYNNKGYVASDYMEYYDISTNTWTIGHNLTGTSSGLYERISFLLDNGSGIFPYIFDLYYNDLDIYFLNSNYISTVSTSFFNSISYMNYCSNFQLNNKGHVIDEALFYNHYIFDPLTETYSFGRDCPASNDKSIGFSLNNKGYIFSGLVSNEIYEYDDSTHFWTLLPTSTLYTVGCAGSFVIDNTAYIVGGHDASDRIYDSMQTLTSQPKQITNTSKLLNYLVSK